MLAKPSFVVTRIKKNGIISQPENRSVEEPDQPDGTLSKRKSLTPRRLSLYLGLAEKVIEKYRSLNQ